VDCRQQLRQVINYAEGTDCRRNIQLGYLESGLRVIAATVIIAVTPTL